MPFSTVRSSSSEVRSMPASAKKIWMAAFTQAMAGQPEAMASDLALARVKEHYVQENGVWVTKKGRDPDEELDPDDPDAEGDPDDPDGEFDPASEEEDPDAEEQNLKGEGEGKAKKGLKLKIETGSEEEVGGEQEGEADPAQAAAAEAEMAEERAAMAKVKAKLRAKRKAKLGDGTDSVDSVDITETMMLDSAGFRLTPDGYLVANPRVARTGIQIYRGSEVGRPDMPEVRIYRSEHEVFNKKALASLAHRPITLDHPNTPVNAKNWRKLAIGKSDGDVARDGDFVRVPLVLMDADAITSARSGASQLSVGYGALLKWGAGQAPDGQLYDAIQTEIRANHIALVSAARGGDKLRIGDVKRNRSEQRRKTMSDFTMNLDGVSIELEAKDGQILQRHLSGLNKRLSDQAAETTTLKDELTASAAKLAAAQKDIATKDGEIVVLKQNVADSAMTTDAINKLISDRMEVVDRATTFFGDTKYAWADKSDAQIRRDVVVARLGDAKVKAMDDGVVQGAFLAITETEANDGITRTAKAFSGSPVNGNFGDRAAKAYDKRNEELQNRFRKNKKPFVAAAS